MKKNRFLISLLFIVFIGFGWVSLAGNKIKLQTQYNNNVKKAEEYQGKKLYEKAIEEYEAAWKIKKDTTVYEKMLSAYELSFAEGTCTKKDCANAMLTICEEEPENPAHWERLIQFYIDCGDYRSAHSIVNKCKNTKVDNETLSDLMDEVLYAYSIKKKTYQDLYRSPKGVYALYDGVNWGVMDAEGEWVYECQYEFAGPVNQKDEVYLTASNGRRVINKKGVTEYLLDYNCTKVKAYSEGYLPILNEKGMWQYYSCEENKFVFSEYEDVSTFLEDRALVKTNGKWKTINSDGEFIEDQIFEDVKLYGNGEYTYSDVMVASQDGKYYIFDSVGNKESKDGYQDMDVFLGEYIAFKNENGKWGFVDKEGKVKIEPQFVEAKSFSNGLAAVSNGETWGFINTDGKVVIDYQFVDADYFTDEGVCFVSTMGESYYMIKLRFN